MAAYLIADVEVIDSAAMDEYRRAVGPTLAKYGGKVIAARSRFEAIEGNWVPNSVVLIEFESFERAKQWYDSEEYREPKQIRQRAARTNLVVVDGV